MKINRQLAWEKLNEMLDNQNLVKHCLAVEAAMSEYADFFNIDTNEKTKWQISGLVHDADWEKFPTQHPQIIINWLEDNQAESDIINAVAAHGFNFQVEAQTQMAQVLRACDELTGLITAVALVKNKQLSQVTVESVKNKWNKKEFARGVNREDIERGAQEIKIPLDQHIEIVLRAMQKISRDLGL